MFCPETRALCKDATEFTGFQQCESRYGKGRCKLYGVYGDVVWQFDKPADVSWWNVKRGFSATRSQANEGVDVRSVKINWDEHPDELTGEMHYRNSLRNYEINLIIPGVTYCDGSAEFTRKTWAISCRNGLSAEGTFRLLGKDQGSVGEGVDTKGNKINFRVAAKSSR